MFRRMLILAAAIAIGLFFAGCRGEGAPSDAGTSPTAEEFPQVALAVSVARAVESDPDSAEAVLREHELSVEQFEAMMAEIAADPDLSAAFEAAME